MWEKLGLILDPEINRNRKLTAALMPVPEIRNVEDGIIRIYYCPRDNMNRSEMHWFEIKISNPYQIIDHSETALLKHGVIGAFDDSGITLGNIVQHNNEKRVYYCP